MRTVGNKLIAQPQLQPSAAALAQASVHQATAAALMPVLTCGVRKGVYRYATHEAANQASEEALVRAIALSQRHG